MRDALGSVDSVLVLGGASEIGLAIAERLVRGGARTVVLAARRPGALVEAEARLRTLGAARVERVGFDAAALDDHDAFVASVFERVGDIDLVVVAFALLGVGAESDAGLARELAIANYAGAVSVMLPVSERLRAQGHGTIAVLSSVAGERARPTNFVYGSSKAGLDAFAQGLAERLHGSGVRVLIVRPGFVRGRMTNGLPAAPLATTPERVAAAVEGGLRRDTLVVWVPGAMRVVMAVVRRLPRWALRRLPR